MSTKTFESIGNCMELSVGKVDHENLVGVEIRRTNRGWVGIACIAPSDAPALALAVLEAAGWPNEHLATTEILRRLREFDEHVKAVEAEARERAELEAEALELHNAFWDGLEENQIDSWDDERGNAKNSWVSAARRARELAKEATQ